MYALLCAALAWGQSSGNSSTPCIATAASSLVPGAFASYRLHRCTPLCAYTTSSMVDAYVCLYMIIGGLLRIRLFLMYNDLKSSAIKC